MARASTQCRRCAGNRLPGITTQRNSIKDLLGRIRDLKANVPTDGIQRVLSDNTALKYEVRQLNQENQQLKERPQAARAKQPTTG